MVSWQAFPSLLPSLRALRVSLAPKTPFPFLFKRLPRRLLFSLQSPSSARDKKIETAVIYLPPAQGGRDGDEENGRSELADVFEKNENKNETTSVYRLGYA